MSSAIASSVAGLTHGLEQKSEPGQWIRTTAVETLAERELLRRALDKASNARRHIDLWKSKRISKTALELLYDFSAKPFAYMLKSCKPHGTRFAKRGWR